MNLFDIIGPVMVGPSSSHTAGAVRIGYITRKLLGQKVVKAQINLFGSFLDTGKGHGTDKALVAGLLGMQPDDIRIPDSFQIAKQKGMSFSFGETLLSLGHPNSVEIVVTGEKGKVRRVVGASIGGGRIRIHQIDDIETNFSGDYPTLIVRNQDKPGMVMQICALLEEYDINIANLNLHKDPGHPGTAILIIECDDAIPSEIIDELGTWKDLGRVIYLEKEGKIPKSHSKKGGK